MIHMIFIIGCILLLTQSASPHESAISAAVEIGRAGRCGEYLQSLVRDLALSEIENRSRIITSADGLTCPTG